MSPDSSDGGRPGQVRSKGTRSDAPAIDDQEG